MNAIKPFKNKKSPTHWDEAEELWYFSLLGSAGITTGFLTDSTDPKDFWYKKKNS